MLMYAIFFTSITIKCIHKMKQRVLLIVSIVSILFSSCTTTQGKQYRKRMAIPSTSSSMRKANCLPHGYR